MDVLNVNYDQDDIPPNKRYAHNLICKKIQATYKRTLSPYHFKCMYFEFDKKRWHGILPFFVLPSHGECFLRVGWSCERWICILALCYFSSKGGISYKKINDQPTSSLANQVPKNPKSNNAQHVPEIVELDDFDIEETKLQKDNLWKV